MPKLEFFIERGGHHVLTGANGELQVPARFPDEASAADAAIRFAQDQDAQYALYYCVST